MPITADNLPDDPAASEAAHRRDGAGCAGAPRPRSARLKFQLARYRGLPAGLTRGWPAGRSSEKLAREAEQLELALEALETDQTERLATASPEAAAAIETAAAAQKPARRPLPQHLPREDRRHPPPCTCPGCGGALRKIADEVSETLDYVPGRFKSLPSRKRGSCGTFARSCRAGFATRWWRRRRPITRLPAAGPGAGLLAHIVVSKCGSRLLISDSDADP